MTEATTVTSFDNITNNVHGTNITYTAKEQVTAYGSLYSMALFCIVVGSVRSLYFVQKHIRKKRLIETSITMKEAKKFPFTASCVLFGLYIFFKCDTECRHRIYLMISSYLPSQLSSRFEILLSLTNAADIPVRAETPSKTLLQKAMQLSFVNRTNIMYLLLLLLCWEGCIALATISKPFFTYLLRKLPIGNREPRMNYSYFWSLKKSKVELEEGDIEEASNDDCEYLLKIEWDSHDVMAILCCLCVGISHVYRRHWLTNNILGAAFSIYGIESIHLCSFKAGTMLLAGLFIYDIFWVFATDVMTTVAKGIDAPILLQFPQDIYRQGFYSAEKFAMLGLGDIVIPGIFIALLRRFDHSVGARSKCKKPRYYFFVTTLAYGLGLMITMGVMHFFKAAQPALLYLVPACVLVPLSVASFRGEAREMFNYCEEHLTEKKTNLKSLKNEKKIK
ncbi:unnamed protein product [Thelazia callipaeda]|uniref:Minor histocompatibility antigen H13 n=1 Tax=Thelazia callipaeda TaxID=103827 RepID=A0A0N5CZ46_THECL|nr:unnamed protein product [Thelazia callipaeda]